MNGIGIKHAAFTGYPAVDLLEARRFYGEILGLRESTSFAAEGEPLHWLEFDIPGGHTLAIAEASEMWQPSEHGGGLSFEMEDLDAAVAKLEAEGVKIALPVQDFPYCRMALIADPSGNTICLHQKKANHPECSH